MNDTNFTLSFVGPFGLTGNHDKILFYEPEAHLQGVYIWTIPYIPGGLIVNYVGETSTSFGQRMKDHLIQKVGGNYRISDPDQIVNGIDAVIWNGLWRKGTRDKMGEYVEMLVDLAPKIQKSIALINVFVAPLEVEKRVRHRVETAFAEHIKSQPPPDSSLLPRDIRYYAKKKEDETSFSIQVQCEAKILGMPSRLNV